MKLSQLREFLAIVEHGSLRAAARRLAVLQPALTRSIKNLENELGVALFERDVSGMRLTTSGQAFHRRASTIVQEAQRAREEIDQIQGQAQGNVSVALSIMPHVYMLPRALPAFRQRYPNTRVQLIEALLPAVESRLRDGSIDFYIGAVTRDPPGAGLTTQVLFENTRAVVARKGHPLAQARSLQALVDARWATTWVDYDAAGDLADVFDQHGLPPPTVTLQVRSTMSLLVGLAHSDLLAMVPTQWQCNELTSHSIQVLPIAEVLPAPPIVLVRRPGLSLTPPAEHLCDLLLRYTP